MVRDQFYHSTTKEKSVFYNSITYISFIYYETVNVKGVNVVITT